MGNHFTSRKALQAIGLNTQTAKQFLRQLTKQYVSWFQDAREY